MYLRGMTAYIGAAWRLKRAAMSISTKGAIGRGQLASHHRSILCQIKSSGRLSSGI